MKTIKEHLSELPEPYRSRALTNLNPLNKNDLVATKHKALIDAFN